MEGKEEVKKGEPRGVQTAKKESIVQNIDLYGGPSLSNWSEDNLQIVSEKASLFYKMNTSTSISYSIRNNDLMFQ